MFWVFGIVTAWWSLGWTLIKHQSSSLKDYQRHTTVTGSRSRSVAESRATFLVMKEEKKAYDLTPEQQREAEEILPLDDLKSALYTIMEELEHIYGVSGFSIASADTRASFYFASPSAQPFVEYECNRMRSVLHDQRDIFYRWNLFLHSRA
ncbi:hypothetical protein V1524DRAFT_419051 [Lipomyces starkeyi]